jgi:predicted PurR-regulated permease PerM
VTVGRGTVFWLAVLGAVGLLLWLLRSILLPFVVGMALAYLLDPVVAWLERRHLSRTIAASILILGTVGIGILVVLLVAPVLFAQITSLLHQLPAVVTAAQARLQPWLVRVLESMREAPVGDLTAPLGDAAQQAVGTATGLVGELLVRGLAVLNVLTLLAITPLVGFYLLRDWPKIIAEIDGWLPLEHADTIRAQLRAIDGVLAGFARGTFLVCAMLAVYYALALSIVGLDFGLVIGLVAGLVSFVPYLGLAIGLASSVGVALYQWWPSWGHVLVVLGILLFGELMNGNVLTPWLVGSQVGLHPLWVIFGVFAGAALFGFVGMLIAVPVVAVIGVLARFALDRYRSSTLYRGDVDLS